jgi:hypothetical protein
MSFLGENMDMNRANSVRSKMNRLKTIAEKTGCAVILVGHLNKNAGGKANYRGLGSIDFSAAARSILAIGKPPEHPEIRVMVHQKSNLGPIGQSMAFGLEDGKVNWLGSYDITPEELFSAPVPRNNIRKSLSATAFLLQYLSNGKKPSEEILQAAEKLGISKRTLMRAKEELKILSVKICGCWYWMKDKGGGDDGEEI